VSPLGRAAHRTDSERRSLAYFFSALPRLFAIDYTPSTQDILHTYAQTRGITQTILHLKQCDLAVFDVGGVRSERRKWIHCFDAVTTILFVMSLSDYDQCIKEERDQNHMAEAIVLWESVSRSKWFIRTSFVRGFCC
jgi:hypothetical protein